MTESEYEKKMRDLIESANNLNDKQIRKTRKILERLRKDIAAQIASTEWELFRQDEILEAIDEAFMKFSDDLIKHMDTVALTGAKSGDRLIGDLLKMQDIKSVTAVSDTLLGVLQGYSADLITGLTDDLIRTVSDTIIMSLVEGLSVFDTMQEIGGSIDAGIFASIDARAETITRTEFARANAMARDARIQKVVTMHPDKKFYKRWIHSGRSLNARKRHAQLNGKTISYNSLFQLDTANASYPHEPGLPPSEICNCRCVHILVWK